LIRIQLCTEGLSPTDREAILEALYDELHISPGSVSSDGEFELEIVACEERDETDAPYLRLDGTTFGQVTPQRARDLVRSRRNSAVR